MAFLFLETAGVLGKSFDKEPIDLLNKIISDTKPLIVLSGECRDLLLKGCISLEGLTWMMKTHGVKDIQLVGVTDNSVAGTKNRGAQVAHWLANNAYPATMTELPKLAIVDDANAKLNFEPYTDKTVLVKNGLTSADADKLIVLLKERK